MAVPAINYELYIWLSVVRAIEVALTPHPTIKVYAEGYREPAPVNASVIEWVQFWPLGVFPKECHRNNYFASALFQVSCCSLLAEQRADLSRVRPWEIASIIGRSLSQRDLPVNDWSDNGSFTQQLGVFSIKEGTSRYMNQRAHSATGQPSDRGIGLPAQMHMVAVTFRGMTDLTT